MLLEESTAKSFMSKNLIKGMMFEIDSPSGKWMPSFNPGEFKLISENVLKQSDGGEETQFTFEALQRGRFAIILLPQSIENDGKKSIQDKSVRYTIMVS